MDAEQHLRKAERIERSLARCHPDDFEIVIEGCMLAATHRFNELLHRTGLAAADIMHAEFVTIAERRRIRVVLPRQLEALDVIESLRTPYVRGDADQGGQAAQRALACLAILQEPLIVGRHS